MRLVSRLDVARRTEVKVRAGSEPGDGHLMEVEMTLQELAEILGDELELPRIEPKGQANIIQEKYRYNSIRRKWARIVETF